MRVLHTRPVGGAMATMLCAGIGCVALTLLLSSCGADRPLQRDVRQDPRGRAATPYSVVFVIHGDGDYLYHDSSGTARTADEEALAAAKRIAQRNAGAEVFIFHQIPREHVLFFFPLHDGEFYYYRNGLLVTSESYWRDAGETHFDPEAKLYREFHGDNKGAKTRVFVYCGHEIPEWGTRGYDASYPDRPFSVDDMAGGLKTFAGDSARFDLMILSTCFGGTPRSLGALGPYARFVVASPDNLHLSYFDLHPLERLDLGLRDGDVHAFAERFARQAFDRLTRDVQTAVSVSVYDTDLVLGYLRSVGGMYDRMLGAVEKDARASPATIERCDCADIPAFVLPGMHQGVEVFYRAPLFGRSKLKQGHSGWECWRGNGVQGSLVPGEPAPVSH